MDTPYIPRLIRNRVLEALADTPVVCLLGPRQVGKSTLAKHLEPERTYISLDDSSLLQTAKLEILQTTKPRLSVVCTLWLQK